MFRKTWLMLSALTALSSLSLLQFAAFTHHGLSTRSALAKAPAANQPASIFRSNLAFAGDCRCPQCMVRHWQYLLEDSVYRHPGCLPSLAMLSAGSDTQHESGQSKARVALRAGLLHVLIHSSSPDYTHSILDLKLALAGTKSNRKLSSTMCQWLLRWNHISSQYQGFHDPG